MNDIDSVAQRQPGYDPEAAQREKQIVLDIAGEAVADIARGDLVVHIPVFLADRRVGASSFRLMTVTACPRPIRLCM